MYIKDVSICKSMTVHIGNHQYHKVEVGMTASLDDAKTFDHDIESLTELVNIKLAAEIEKVMPAPKRQTLVEKVKQ